MIACAMLAAFFLLRADLKRRGFGPDSEADAEALIAVPCLAGIIGAKLYHVFESPRELFADPYHQIFSQYGFAWFGGLLAGFAAFLLLARSIAKRTSKAGRTVSILEFLDVGSPAAALGYGIGRIGCLLSGDGDYGIPTSLPWGMSFPHGLVPTTQRVHPTPIYELIVACVIAWLLWCLGARTVRSERFNSGQDKLREQSAEDATPGKRKNSGGSRGAGAASRDAKMRGASAVAALSAPPGSTQRSQTGDAAPPAMQSPAYGQVFAAYLVLTGIARFLVEFIRINPRSFFGMSNAQAASVASVIVGVILWWKLSRATPDRVSRAKT